MISTSRARARRPTLILAAVLALGVISAASAPDRPPAPLTVYVVRHAEAVPDAGKDPPLSEAGVERAVALRAWLRRSNVSAIYASNYRRAQGTALTLAESQALAVHTYDARDAAGLARHIRERHEGRAVLVVGHSNTVPAIIEALGGARPPDLRHDEYDAIFVVRVMGDSASVTKLHYGKPTPPARER
jgi:phosphohistidine phosphatase SixA